MINADRSLPEKYLLLFSDFLSIDTPFSTVVPGVLARLLAISSIFPQLGLLRLFHACDNCADNGVRQTRLKKRAVDRDCDCCEVGSRRVNSCLPRYTRVT
jgi:hypothetical protein